MAESRFFFPREGRPWLQRRAHFVRAILYPVSADRCRSRIGLCFVCDVHHRFWLSDGLLDVHQSAFAAEGDRAWSCLLLLVFQSARLAHATRPAFRLRVSPVGGHAEFALSANYPGWAAFAVARPLAFSHAKRIALHQLLYWVLHSFDSGELLTHLPNPRHMSRRRCGPRAVANAPCAARPDCRFRHRTYSFRANVHARI